MADPATSPDASPLGNIRPITLNMLPVLRELLRQRNVTRAAASLNMSQSAVSETLARSRLAFDDELLLPSNRGFELSQKAESLLPRIEEVLDPIDRMLNTVEFDPAYSNGRIHIATSDYVALTIGPRLVAAVRTQAPGLAIQFHDVDGSSVSALAAGHLDFVFVPDDRSGTMPGGIERRALFDDELVLLSNGAIAEDASGTTDWSGPVRLMDEDSGAPQWRPAIRQSVGDGESETTALPGFMLLPFIAEGAGIVACLPKRLAERLLPATGNIMRVPPKPLPAVRISVLWSKARQGDPLHMWLLQLLTDIGTGLKG